MNPMEYSFTIQSLVSSPWIIYILGVLLVGLPSVRFLFRKSRKEGCECRNYQTGEVWRNGKVCSFCQGCRGLLVLAFPIPAIVLTVMLLIFCLKQVGRIAS